MYAGRGQRQSASPAGSSRSGSPGFQILSRTPSPFREERQAAVNASGEQRARRAPTVVARGGPGRSVGRMYHTPQAQAQMAQRAYESPSSNDDVEIDSDIGKYLLVCHND